MKAYVEVTSWSANINFYLSFEVIMEHSEQFLDRWDGKWTLFFKLLSWTAKHLVHQVFDIHILILTHHWIH